MLHKENGRRKELCSLTFINEQLHKEGLAERHVLDVDSAMRE